MALLLRKQGVQKIRPLLGGLDGWRKMGYPVAQYRGEEEADPETGTQTAHA